MVKVRQSVQMKRTIQTARLHFNTKHRTFLTTYRRRKQKTVMHMKAKLATYSKMTRSKTVMNRRKVKKKESRRIVTRLQQRTNRTQVIERLVKMRTMTTKTTSKLRIIKVKKGMKMMRRKMRRTVMTRRRTITFMQKISVVLANQMARKSTSVY